MEKFSVSVSCQWSRKRTLGDRARGRKPGPLLFWCREAPTRSTTASRTEWSPTTTGLARTSRSARTSCCLRTHTLHQQQAARQQQGLPPAGLAWEQHPLPRPVYNPSLSFPLGKEPARWLTLGHSRGATHSHATRCMCRSSNKGRRPASALGAPILPGHPRASNVGATAPHGRWTARDFPAMPLPGLPGLLAASPTVTTQTRETPRQHQLREQREQDRTERCAQLV